MCECVRVWVSRGKLCAMARQPVDVEISGETSPVQCSPPAVTPKSPGQNPPATREAPVKKRSRDERDSRRQTGWMMDGGPGWMDDGRCEQGRS